MAIETAPVPDSQMPEPDALTLEIRNLANKTGEIAAYLQDARGNKSAAVKAEYEQQKEQLAKLTEQQHQKSIGDAVEAYLANKDARPRKLEFDAGADTAGDAFASRNYVGLKAGIPLSRRQTELNRGESWAYVLYRARARSDPAYQAKLWEWETANLEALNERWGGKALAEGSTTSGGFLVVPQYIQELVLLRRATAPLLDYVRMVPTRSNLVYVPTQTTVMTVGWTAENATKPSTDEVYGQIAVNIFTLAGIAKISNQLLEDSTPSVDDVIRQDLMRGLNIEMDRVVINGSGTGQGTGILNTSGVTVTPATDQNRATIVDDTLAAIGRLQAAYFGSPDAIVMAPRTWTKLQRAKDSTGRLLAIGTVAGYPTLNMPGLPNPTGSTDSGTGLGGGPQWSFFGYPLVIDANMPINLTVAANSNRSSIIVGAFREAWLLTRDDIRTDVSNVAGTAFETNQTWFRSECRVGFTAARLPTAFQVISDEGPDAGT